MLLLQLLDSQENWVKASLEQWKKGTLSPGNIEIAIKSLKKGASNLDRVKFLQEAAIMAQFKHPNVVNLFGIVKDGNTVNCNTYPITVTSYCNHTVYYMYFRCS